MSCHLTRTAPWWPCRCWSATAYSSGRNPLISQLTSCGNQTTIVFSTSNTLLTRTPHYGGVECMSIKQELSYRKHIARKLHTQYVKAINRPKYYNVTLKCRLRVTQLDRSYTTDYWSSYLTLNIIVTLKCGLQVTQDHWKWYHLKPWVRFPIRLP